MTTDIDYINDNIHGRIELNNIEQKIIKTPAFQRLGRIQQLGLASLVFPSATHRRLSHSLGTLHVATKIIRELNRKKPGTVTPEEERILRVAALLHDIGQYPLSHAIEFVYKRLSPTDLIKNRKELTTPASTFLRKATSQTPSSFEDASDKEMSEAILRYSPELKDILDTHFSSNEFEDIISIIKGALDMPLYQQLLDSHYDCDRIDSITRDANLCGVSYGIIELDYFIENLHCIYDPPHIAGREKNEKGRYLAIDKKKALHTIEHFLIARYFMYSQVIHHKHVKSFELLAKAIFFALAQDGIVFSNYVAIKEAIKTGDFLSFDDNYFHQKISDYCKSPAAKEHIKKWIKRLSTKEPLQVISEIKKLSKGEEKDIEYTNYKTWFFNDENLKILCKEANVPFEEIIPNEIKVIFVPLDMDVLSMLSESMWPMIEEARKQYKLSPRLYNEGRPEHIEMLLSDPSSFVRQLLPLSLSIITIYSTYTDGGLPAKIMKAFNRHSSS